MKLKKLASLTSAAALLMAMAAPAFADSVSDNVTQSQSGQVSNNGDTSNSANPPVGATQSSSITGNAGQGATGNIGFNSTSGNANQQANTLVLETNTTAVAGGGLNGSTYSTQTLANVGNGGTATTSGYVNNNNTSTLNTTFTGSAGPNGNVGENTSAGDFNQQANLTVLSLKPAAVQADNGLAGTSNMTQTINGMPNSGPGASDANSFAGGTDMRGSSYSSSIGNTTGNGVQGNAGFNTAAGEKNVQENSALLYGPNGNPTSSSGVPSGNQPQAQQQTTQFIGPAGSAANGYTSYGDTVHLTGGGSYSSTIGGTGSTALSSVSGNVGANSAAGASNLQMNNAIIGGSANFSSISQDTGAGSGQTIQYTTFSNNTGVSNPSDPNFNKTGGSTNNYNASVLIQGTTGGSGNVGINTAAGGQNVQENSMLLGDPTAVTQTFNQAIIGSPSSLSVSPTSNSEIGAGTATGFSGRVGVNSSVGAQNEQKNKAAIITNNGAASGTQNFNQSVQGSYANQVNNYSNGGNTAPFSTIDGNAAQNASGSVGLNSAMGQQNVQANGVIIVSGDSTSPAANQYNPQSGSTQVQEASSWFTMTGLESSTIQGNTGQGASGNVGANSAAGVQNIQNNGLILFSGQGATDTSPSATQTYAQRLTVNATRQSRIDSGSDYAAIGQNAAQNATGVIGFNTASGAQNQQSNAAIVFAPTLPSPGTGFGSTTNAGQGGATGTPAASLSSTQSVVGQGSTTAPATYVNENAVGEIGAYVNNQFGNPGQNAIGVVGFNAAAGVGNQQAALVTVITNNAGVSGATGSPAAIDGFTNASLGNSQSVSGLGTQQLGGSYNGYIDGLTLDHASGALSANAVAGDYNQQGNTVLLSTGSPASGATSPGPTLSSGQTVNGTGGSTTITGSWNFLTDIGRSGTSPGQYARGVIGLNAATGQGNQQSGLVGVMDRNFASQGNAPSGSFNPDGSVSNGQSVSNLNVTTDVGQTSGVPAAMAASIDGGTLNHAAGVISANSTAGAFNQQSNVVLVTSGNLGNIAPTGNQIQQNSNMVTSAATQATIGGTALQNASGAIGVNVSAGIGNQQANTVIVQH